MKIFFKIRAFLAVLPLIASFLLTMGKTEATEITFGVGIGIFIFGLGIRIWAQQHLGYKIPRKFRKNRTKRLVTSGPFKICRNPVYIGNIFIMTGLTILTGLYWMAPVTFAWSFGAYYLAVRLYEEPHLRDRYGAVYQEYYRNVPRWFPHFAMFMAALKDTSPFSLSLATKYELYNIGWIVPFILR